MFTEKARAMTGVCWQHSHVPQFLVHGPACPFQPVAIAGVVVLYLDFRHTSGDVDVRPLHASVLVLSHMVHFRHLGDALDGEHALQPKEQIRPKGRFRLAVGDVPGGNVCYWWRWWRCPPCRGIRSRFGVFIVVSPWVEVVAAGRTKACSAFIRNERVCECVEISAILVGRSTMRTRQIWAFEDISVCLHVVINYVL